MLVTLIRHLKQNLPEVKVAKNVDLLHLPLQWAYAMKRIRGLGGQETLQCFFNFWHGQNVCKFSQLFRAVSSLAYDISLEFKFGKFTNFKALLPVVSTDFPSLVPSRSLLVRCPREVWERAGEYLSVTSQLTVESRIDRAENA